MNAGMVSGKSGNISWKLMVMLITATQTSNTYIRSYFTLLKMYLAGIRFLKSIDLKFSKQK